MERLCDLVDARRGTDRRPLITFVTDRLGHDRRYEIDCAKISADLDWGPQVSFEDASRGRSTGTYGEFISTQPLTASQV